MQYFPQSPYVRLAYCSLIVVLFGTIKCLNHVLHFVYDTSEYVEEPGQNVSQPKTEGEKRRSMLIKRREQSQDRMDLGIELQVFNGTFDESTINVELFHN